MIQVVLTACCGKPFAGYVEPYCYQDADWQEDLRRYSKIGLKVELRETCTIGECTCHEVEPSPQPDLFTQPIQSTNQ